MTKNELSNLPKADLFDPNQREFDYLLIFPFEEEHDSGFKYLCIVGGKNNGEKYYKAAQTKY